MKVKVPEISSSVTISGTIKLVVNIVVDFAKMLADRLVGPAFKGAAEIDADESCPGRQHRRVRDNRAGSAIVSSPFGNWLLFTRATHRGSPLQIIVLADDPVGSPYSESLLRET